MILYTLLLPALAHQADPITVQTSDQVPLFEALEVDSGWYPSSGAMGIRVQVGASGTADVDMHGDANLEWPTDLNLSFTGLAEGGEILLSTVLDTSVSIRFDIASYQWEQEIDSRRIEYTGSGVFTPYALGTTETITTDSEGAEAIDYNTTVLGVVDVSFSGVLRPNCSLDFTGRQWSIGENTIENEGETATFSAMEGEASFVQQAVFYGDFDTECALEFIPVFEVCVPIVGCQNWEAGQFDIESLSSAVSHAFPANDLSFGLPALLTTDVVDFGDVDAGELIVQELSVQNAGALLLEGTVEDPAADSGFSVFGGGVYLPPAGQDSIVFSFSSEEAGTHTTTVVLNSNDPAYPAREIILKANVGGGKGCSHLSARNLGGLFLLLPGLAFVYRRQR